MKEETRKLLETATKACLKAGKTIYYYWGELKEEQVSQKSSWKDLVTRADKEAEKEIIEIIQENFPRHKIISEEGGGGVQDNTTQVSLEKEKEYIWVIDPLDGTTNFKHSYPFFCTSIGLVKQKETIVAAIYNPVTREMFTAIKGSGAYLNGVPIKVSSVKELRESLLVTGFSYASDHSQQRSFELFQKFTLSSHGVRRDGAAALDLAYVACGRIEAFWEYGLKSWDMAAGSLLVKEAGGHTIDPQTGADFELTSDRILATNHKLKEILLDKIRF